MTDDIETFLKMCMYWFNQNNDLLCLSTMILRGFRGVFPDGSKTITDLL